MGKPFSSPGDLPDPGIEPMSPVLQADSLPSEPPGKPKSPAVQETRVPSLGQDSRFFRSLTGDGTPAPSRLSGLLGGFQDQRKPEGVFRGSSQEEAASTLSL